MRMTTTSKSVYEVLCAVFCFSLCVPGRGWTAAVLGQTELNNMSFASPSSSSSFVSWPPSALPLLKAENGQEDQDGNQQQQQQKPSRPSMLLPLARRMQSNSRIPTNKNSERNLIARIVRLLPKDKLNRYKLEAARELQANLIRTFQAITNPSEKLTVNIQVAAKQALAAAQGGKLNPAIVRHLPAILQQGSQQQGQPAHQLQVILSNILPHVPSATRGSLQGLLSFVSANLSSVNSLLGRVLGGTPDLLAAVINSLTNNLEAVTGTLNGTLASLGDLLGGVIG